MATNRTGVSPWSTCVLVLSLLLFFFALPHTLEDFATGEPAKQGVPVFALSYVVAGMFALQGLGLYWIGRKVHQGYMVHVILGLFWPMAAGSAQLPKILAQGTTYRAGFISLFHVGGMIVVGILLFITSVLAMRTDRSE